MAIKEAKQSGRNIVITCGNNSSAVSGELIGYTTNAVFVKNSKSIHIYTSSNNNSLNPGSKIISLNTGNEEIKIFGNKIGIKKGNMMFLYDENGRSAGTTPAR